MNTITNNKMQCTLALAGLEMVTDPEIGLNVVDLGLIYQLDFDEENKKAVCTMTLTTQFCPMGESITDGVKQSLHSTFPDYNVTVNLLFDPTWNFEMISEEGRKFINK